VLEGKNSNMTCIVSKSFNK